MIISFWKNINNEELHLLYNKPLLIKLQELVIKDSYFYFVRSEPNGIFVFANSKGGIKLPVTSFKLGTKVNFKHINKKIIKKINKDILNNIPLSIDSYSPYEKECVKATKCLKKHL